MYQCLLFLGLPWNNWEWFSIISTPQEHLGCMLRKALEFLHCAMSRSPRCTAQFLSRVAKVLVLVHFHAETRKLCIAQPPPGHCTVQIQHLHNCFIIIVVQLKIKSRAHKTAAQCSRIACTMQLTQLHCATCTGQLSNLHCATLKPALCKSPVCQSHKGYT